MRRSPPGWMQLLLRARSFLSDRRCKSLSASATRPVRHSAPLRLSMIARSHEVGLVDSWRPNSPLLGMARSRNYPMVQKSPSGLCEIEICHNRIGAPVLLDRCCAFQPDLESIFLAKMLKILLQHYLPVSDIFSAANSGHW